MQIIYSPSNIATLRLQCSKMALTAYRDLVRWQTVGTIVKYLAIGITGLGCEDLMHLMNPVWPNCSETSPHVVGTVMDAIEVMRVTLGSGML